MKESSHTYPQDQTLHPDFSHEQAHLAHVLPVVDQYSQTLASNAAGATGVNPHVARGLREVSLQTLEQIDAVESKPYFARVDFQERGTPTTQPYYIGPVHVDHADVQIVGWQAPIAALFYRATSEQASYDCPAGHIEGSLRLKRRLRVQQRSLLAIQDEFDHRARTPQTLTQPPEDPDGFLRFILASSAHSQLRTIITSIQAAQYALIEADAKQVLVIQGSAGSGKTSVALHRLSFLLYPDNGHAISAQRCIIFGPNKLFLHYITSVLPTLNLNQIVQTTPLDWALRRMNLSPHRVTDTTFDCLLSDTVVPEQKNTLYKRSQLKTSLRMGALLDNYVAHLRSSITFPQTGWTFPATGSMQLQPHLDAQELNDAFTRYADRPLSQQRTLFLRRLQGALEEGGLIERAYKQALDRAISEREAPIRLLEAEIEQLRGDEKHLVEVVETLRSSSTRTPDISRVITQLQQGVSGLRTLIALKEEERQQGRTRLQNARDRAWDPDEDAESRKQLRKLLRAHVQQMIDKQWPSVDVLTSYRRLFASEDLLMYHGAKIFTGEERKVLVQPYTRHKNTQLVIDRDDVPALHYLHLLVHGTDGTSYDHIVVDEAQDVSELEFRTMRQFFSSSKNASCTILGDVSQSLYSHRGIASWNQLQQAFEGSTYTYRELAQSYRTTYEIMGCASTVIQSLNQRGERLPVPIPFERRGLQPQLYAVTNQDALIRMVAQAVQQGIQNGYKNIAIVAKTAERCQALDRQLRLAKLAMPAYSMLLSGDTPYSGGIVIVPAHTTKGLEFDAVIVTDADGRSYTKTAFDGRLLYVAMTRPLHELTVVWTGTPSPHIAQVLLQ